VNEIDNIKEDIKSKMIPSRQCIDDIDNMLITFPAVCSFVHTEKDCAAPIPAFDFLARDFKDCPSRTELTDLQ
jgi:hypothetical protein